MRIFYLGILALQSFLSVGDTALTTAHFCFSFFVLLFPVVYVVFSRRIRNVLENWLLKIEMGNAEISSESCLSVFIIKHTSGCLLDLHLAMSTCEW